MNEIKQIVLNKIGKEVRPSNDSLFMLPEKHSNEKAALGNHHHHLKNFYSEIYVYIFSRFASLLIITYLVKNEI